MDAVMTTPIKSMQPVGQTGTDVELSEPERKFLKRIAAKYGNPKRKPLLQSLLIFTAMIAVAHFIERTSLPSWISFFLVYIPAIYLFSRYRRFGIFKSKLMRKLALREGQREGVDCA